MNLDELTGKSISLIVWNTENENDVRVYLGELNFEHNEIFFANKKTGHKLRLTQEQLSNLNPVPDELKETLLHADYALSMSMGNIPDSDDPGNYEETGIRWLP